jgi:hypothetical protein
MARIIAPRQPSSVPPSPPKLRESLAILGAALKEAEGAPNGRSDGASLSQATVRAVHLQHLHELGSILIQIADGVDARDLFGQSGRHKPKQTAAHRAGALAYFSARIRNPKANDAPAIVAAQLFLRKGISAKTVRKIAQKHRDLSLEALSNHDGYLWAGLWDGRKPVGGVHAISGRARRISSVVLADGNARYIRCWGLKRTRALREYLRKKSPRHVDE